MDSKRESVARASTHAFFIVSNWNFPHRGWDDNGKEMQNCKGNIEWDVTAIGFAQSIHCSLSFSSLPSAKLSRISMVKQA